MIRYARRDGVPDERTTKVLVHGPFLIIGRTCCEELSDGASAFRSAFCAVQPIAMQTVHFDEVLLKILERDSRYHRDAYLFIREALDFTQKEVLKKSRIKPRAHVTGQELLSGIRDFAIQQFGPMAITVLHEWGVRCCEHVGDIVFNMVDFGLLNKTETDSREDFKGGYNFHEAFVLPFIPQSKTSEPPESKVCD